MTDFNNIFQAASLLQQMAIPSTAYTGGGYLPTSLTATLTISGTSALALPFNNVGAIGSSSSFIQPVAIDASTTSSAASSGQQDLLLGTTVSITLVGKDITISGGLETHGRRNQPTPSW